MNSKLIPIYDFDGGIHPEQNKLQSTSLAIASSSLPSKLILPIAQHIGAPSKPCVQVGENVLKGQVIATAKGFVSSNLHAPTSGTITTIEEQVLPHQSGMSGMCITLIPDGKEQWIEHEGLADYQQTDRDDIIARIQAAGIVGLGGAGFPSHVKNSLPANKIDTLIINAAECEPYITADDVLMREHSAEILSGIEIIKHILQPQSCLIGIEDNKPEAIAALQAEIIKQNLNIQVVVIPTKYPSGGEKQLIQILTNKEVPVKGFPADIGVVCHNVGTAFSIHDAIINGRPLISRITTITGEACGQPQNFHALIGTPIEHLLQQANTNTDTVQRLIMGGPMMGFTLPSAELPIVKTTNCIIATANNELPMPASEQACIRCGMCTEACPAQLLPQQLYWFAKSSNLEQAQRHNIADCIECGACAYVCPSNIPLVQYYRFAKGEIRQAAADKQKSERAKTRFEGRLARQEREANEKEAKRQARAAAAAAKQAEKKAAQEAEPAVVAEAIDFELLNKKLSAAQTGLEKAQQKLASAQAENSDKVTLFEGAVSKMQAKYDEAKQALSSAEQTQQQTDIQTSADTQSNLEQLQQKVLLAQTRVDKAQERLAMAKEQNLDTAAAMQLGLDKQLEKLAQAQQALKDAQS